MFVKRSQFVLDLLSTADSVMCNSRYWCAGQWTATGTNHNASNVVNCYPGLKNKQVNMNILKIHAQEHYRTWIV